MKKANPCSPGITLGRKKVLQSDPFIPDPRFFTGFVGREEELNLVTASWISGDHSNPMNPLMIGEPGVGKNRLIYEFARKAGYPLYIFQGHEDVTAEDIACSVRFSDLANNVMDYILSPLVTAMIHGGICFIDEIGKIRPRALALLVSVLDERRYIDSTLLGERIHAHPAFRFIAATNSTDLNLLPEFILSRLRPRITIGYPSKREIDLIIRNQCQGMNGEIDKLTDLFWVLWTEYGGRSGSIAPRDAIYLFGLAAKWSAFESAGMSEALSRTANGDTISLPVQPSEVMIRPSHLEKAFRELFQDSAAKTTKDEPAY